jgi:hypothetical protein
MTLKTLEQRFNETSKDIYNRFKPDRDQLVSIKPDTNGVFGSRSRVKNDTRALPTTSFVRDSRRISNFLKSPQGRLYIGKQAVLQTGNTFEQTRIYNPLSNIRIPNALRIKRYIGNDTSEGLLQSSTITSFSGTGKTATSITSMLGNTNITNANVRFDRPELQVFSVGDNIYSPFLSTQPTLGARSTPKGSVFAATKVNGQVGDLNNRAFNYGLEFRLTANGRPTAIPSEQIRNNDRLKKKFDNLDTKFKNGGILTDFYFAGNNRGFGAELNAQSGLFEHSLKVSSDDPPVNRMVTDRTIPYDRLNTVSPYKTFNLGETNRIDYAKLVPTNEQEAGITPDIINFTFQANGQGQPIIKFRAFISQFKQSTKPEYQEQKYIGRTERFVAYSGAKRTASLVFNIVAFSQSELPVAWSKINYLTGLAFPLGVSSGGFMIPPLFKISIGGIYDAQPCYIENLDFDFIDNDITFDVDNEVSQFVNVNMSIVLLEKRSRFYNSPFYQITQDLVGPESQSPTQPELIPTITNPSQQV